MDKLIVSCTSYPKRINTLYTVLNSILQNTLKPDKIVCNLSTTEFPQKEKSLPTTLRTMVEHNLVEIFWVTENTKQFKKCIPTIQRFPDDIIISIDDDRIYPANFIKTLYDEFCKHGKQVPITCGKCPWDCGIYGHHGSFTIFKKSFFGDFLLDIYNNLVLPNLRGGHVRCFDDALYTYSALLNGVFYKHLPIQTKTIDFNEKISNVGTVKYKQDIQLWHGMLQKYILDKYHLNLNDLVNNRRIIVNFTTWKKRDFAVPIMLRNFSKQTLKPTKIICWLSIDEYGHRVPPTIQTCLDNGLLTEVKWVKGNTFSHKRWETFLENDNAYNVMIDDDILYPSNYLERLIGMSKQHPSCVTTFYCCSKDYNSTNNKQINGKNYVHRKNILLSGLSCFPPNTFPLESFNYTNLRDKYCTKCDDSWVLAWLIKKGVVVFGGDMWTGRQLNTIENTQRIGIWETDNSKTNVHGIKNKMSYFANALIIANAVNDAKKIWPYFNIEKCCNPDLLPLLEKQTNVIINNQVVSLKKKLTISLTSFRPRISNLTVVLPSLVNQTHKVDRIVVNLSPCEFPNKEKDLPKGVVDYIASQGNLIEINWVDGLDTHMWRKFIPTLLKYKDDLVLGVDDDYIYPSDMVEEFCKTHIEHPDAPISGNRLKMYGLNCHCGSASLIQYKHFQGYIENIPQEILDMVASQDLFYTYIASRNNYTYVQTQQQFFTNLQQYNSVEPFKKTVDCTLEESWNRLTGYYETPKPRKTIVKVVDNNDKQYIDFKVEKPKRNTDEYSNRVKTVLSQIGKPKSNRRTFKGLVKKSSKMYSKSKFI